MFDNQLNDVNNMRGFLNFDTMKTICEGWITSVLVYCLPLFGGCNKYETEGLQIIQKKNSKIGHKI